LPGRFLRWVKDADMTIETEILLVLAILASLEGLLWFQAHQEAQRFARLVRAKICVGSTIDPASRRSRQADL
jgi:hypothetical protein